MRSVKIHRACIPCPEKVRSRGNSEQNLLHQVGALIKAGSPSSSHHETGLKNSEGGMVTAAVKSTLGN